MLAALLMFASSRTVDPQVEAARGVLERTIGLRAEHFELARSKSVTGKDSFSIEAHNGIVYVEGTSGVAICRGAYEYLKEKCHVMVSWEGKTVRLPGVLPNLVRRTESCPLEYRHYYNICTFGYTTAFWGWSRWQQEIDWMALHGINMPLALTGQDKVWQTVFRSLNVPDKSINAFFSGPAFQPWHWMGNLNGHAGPPPQSWLDGQAKLQKLILKRERSLGMKPIVPGFSGFVPVDFAMTHPKVQLESPTAWAGFEPTTFVDIRDPMFVEIGRRFVQEYRKEFGSDHFYLCDTFNEQNPQFPDATKMADLKSAGSAVYKGLRQGDSNATWVMQGWLFFNEKDYWKAPEIEALLSGVPDGKMIILDLACDQFEVWRAQPAVARKGWIFNTLHNYGQNTGLGGDLQGMSDRQFAALNDKSHGRMLGFGLTPEGIEQNPVVYELMTDAMWRTEPFRVSQDWLPSYVTSRYGIYQPDALEAWGSIYRAIYSKNVPWYRDGWRSRPGSLRRGRPLTQVLELERAVMDLVNATLDFRSRRENPLPAMPRNELFDRDMVDVTKTWLGAIADRHAYAAMQAWPDDKATYLRHKDAFFRTLDDIDRVMATRPEHRLTTWIALARSWGTTPAEKDLMERNARLQVTAWDTKGVLTDYANKEWAGLTDDFIARRWKKYFADLEANRPTVDPAGYLKLELDWANSTMRPEESPVEEPRKLIAEIYARRQGEAAKIEKELGQEEPPGNLAREGVASDDGHTEANADPSKAIDGNLDSYWAASPSPCTWDLDLKTVRAVQSLQVFTYYGDGRYYQYVVETSVNGQEWKTAMDRSANTTAATAKGDRIILPAPVQARYMRVRMLKNSANIGVHLLEVRVYAGPVK